MKDNVIEMSKYLYNIIINSLLLYRNVAEVEDKLLPNAVEIAMESRKFGFNAKKLLDEAKKRNFWMGSPKCIGIFGGALAIVIAIIVVIFEVIKKK